MSVNPRKWIISAPKKWLPFLIWLESWVAWLLGGSKASKALLTFYSNYRHFTTHTYLGLPAGLPYLGARAGGLVHPLAGGVHREQGEI